VSLSSGVLTVTDGANNSTLQIEPLSSSSSCRSLSTSAVACRTSAFSKIVMNGNGGNDQQFANVPTKTATLNGGPGDDALYDGPGNDTLNGDDGNDGLGSETGGTNTFNGGNGADGGAGSDSAVIDAGDTPSTSRRSPPEPAAQTWAPASTEARSGRPPVGPSSGSTACSGCGISPTTLPAWLLTPAMSATAPLGLWPGA
jgi:RTX calcium-binding nonapeptide repeat (4 copies)